MIEIESGDVMQMRDASFSDLLDEINSKAGQLRISAALCWTAIGLGVAAGIASGGPGLAICALALPGWAAGKWFDSYRRCTVLYYDLEGDAEAAYHRLTEGFDGLNQCAAKWHIEAGGAVQSLTAWKRNAGASHLVERKATTLAYNLPSIIKSNVAPPALRVGKQIMYFMPDVVFVFDGKKIGAVDYSDLGVRWQNSRFIETEQVPKDATIVGYNWKYPNKSGGPDRRFKGNRQIPICLYETIHFQSESGVNELVEFSRADVASAFGTGCEMLRRLPRERAAVLPTALSQQETHATPATEPTNKRHSLGAALLVVLGFLVGVPIVGSMLEKGETVSTIDPAGFKDPITSATLSKGVSQVSSGAEATFAPRSTDEESDLITIPAATTAASSGGRKTARNANPDETTTHSVANQDAATRSTTTSPAPSAATAVRYTQSAVKFQGRARNKVSRCGDCPEGGRSICFGDEG